MRFLRHFSSFLVAYVYVAGFELKEDRFEAKLWKNGELANTLGHPEKSAIAYSVFAIDGNTYVAGSENDISKLWKNGEVIDLNDGSKNGEAHSVYVVKREVIK